ncbi:hypothetical protein DPMN_035880 [Dreissena polymorpha]|uniref:Uncharacterized protein n=1 Tax=Dreissena polymorpha TaxID=45954 RepID=A0A9D4M8E2_DREPO|nr:hypothetical protein DPMN_035880 [Dreissena polymorpha]
MQMIYCSFEMLHTNCPTVKAIGDANSSNVTSFPIPPMFYAGISRTLLLSL